MNDTYDALMAALAGAPSLPGARCRGRSHLFDEARPDEDTEQTRYRHDHALRLCATCPALASCTAWYDDLPKSKKPPGVVAGRVNSQAVDRPRRSTA